MIADKDKFRIEVEFPKITYYNLGLSILETLSKTRLASLYGKISTYSMPIITAISLYMTIGGLMVLILNTDIRQVIYTLGALNPFTPLAPSLSYVFAGYLSVVVASNIGRGIVARVYKVKIESCGISTIWGVFPTNPFINLDKEQISKLPLRQKSAIFTASPLSNCILAIISFIALLMIVSSLEPLPTPGDGVEVIRVDENSIASSIGITNGDVIVNIEGERIGWIEDLVRVLQSNLGKRIEITWKVNNSQEVTKSALVPTNVPADKGILGVTITNLSPDPEVVLSRYKNAFMSNPIAILLPPTKEQGGSCPRF